MEGKNKLISIFLGIVMLIGLFPVTLLPVAAEESDPVAMVGEDTFTDLYKAVSAAEKQDGSTITLLSDVALKRVLEINTSGNAITLDLNDHGIIANHPEITPSSPYSSTVIFVYANSIFTLTDNAENKTTRYVMLDSSGRGTSAVMQKPEQGTEGVDYITVTGGYITGGDVNATSSGGGVTITNADFTMNGGTICGNHGWNNGGGIRVEGRFTMNGGKICGNRANVYGGGVYIAGKKGISNTGQFTMNGGEISGNSVSAESGSVGGGGVCVFSEDGANSWFKMNGGAINNNKADYYGGGVLAYNSEFTMDGESAEISGNTATYSGGGVLAWNNSAVSLKNGKLSSNTATTGGGGVYVLGSTVTMNGAGAEIRNNSASNFGGGVYIENLTGSRFVLENGKVSGNTAGSFGGGVFVWAPGQLEMSGGEMSDNSATCGGGVTVWDGGDFTMTGGSIKNNRAESLVVDAFGGGVYTRGTFTMDGETAEISGNFANLYGGGVFADAVQGCEFTMKNGAVSGNTTIFGGGVFVNSVAKYNLEGGSVSGNTAMYDGGGVYVAAGGTLAMTGGEIKQNISASMGGTGGAVYCTGKLNASGTPCIRDNQKGNLYLLTSGGNEALITVTGAFDDEACIGVTKLVQPSGETQFVPAPGVFAEADKDYNDGKLDSVTCFISDVEAYGIGFTAEKKAAFGESVTVSFDSQNGDEVFTQKAASGYALAKPADPSEEGCDFGGWYKEAACENAWDFDGDTVSEAMTLYAKWTVPVTGVSLNPSSAQTIPVGGKVSFTAFITPDNATEKTVKWSVGGTNSSAVTLYSDETCETPVTLDTATDKLTVYARGMLEGTATVSVTSTADSTKSASCAVTVNTVEYSVTITAGDHMTKTTESGAATQTNLTGAMTDVVYIVNNGYYFPENYSVEAVNGITVTRNSFTQITVSGTPTADAAITLTAPTAKTDQTAPTGLTATKASGSTATDGKISGVTDAMEYQKDGDTSWTAVANNKTEITGLTAGTYKVRYAGMADKNASPVSTVEVGVKVAPTVTAPTAKTLTYNGQAQELVIAGSTEDGTLYYAVTTENVAPTDESLYTTSIPTATNARTYYVWYKVVGDDNHADTEPACIVVTIDATKPAQTAPAAPVVTASTPDSITVKTVRGVEFSIDGEHWQTSGVFTGLNPDTTYVIQARKPETESHAASPTSATVVNTPAAQSPAGGTWRLGLRILNALNIINSARQTVTRWNPWSVRTIWTPWWVRR